MKKILCLLCILIVSPAFGAKDVGAYNMQWGNRPFDTCVSHNFPSSALIVGTGEIQAYDGSCRDGWGYKLMVALDVTDTGAYFCPVFVYALNTSWGGDTWTRYGRYGDGNDCVWLCLPGYTGNNCRENTNYGTTSSSCNIIKFSKDNYSKYTGTSTETESEIAMFHQQSQKYCGNKATTAENDVILAVTGFLDSGHGAYVSQVAVTAKRTKGYKWNNAWGSCSKNYSNIVEKQHAFLNYNDGSQILVCKNGYQPNKDGTDCEAISQEACNVPLCEKVANDFNSQFHTIVEYKSGGIHSSASIEEQTNLERAAANANLGEKVSTQASCTFKCKDPEQGLKSTDDKTCVECKRELRQGISATDYTCLQCEQDEVYDSLTGSCVPAIGLSKTDLMYGYERTASATDDMQCWQKADMEAYRKCIKDSLP